ncbi:MAG: hypothetical protein FWC13_05355 [Oscillospiraceae bacterium]|nr:hypothetical protein [Oscillospiraceae bacterium]
MKFEKSRLEPLKINLGGVEYPVQVNFSAMARFEEYFDMPFIDVFAKLGDVGKLKALELRQVLYIMLESAGVELDVSDLDGVLFNIDTLNVISEALDRANKIVNVLDDAGETEDSKPGKKPRAVKS